MSFEVCVLASGSSGNSTYVSSGRTRVLVDCGLVARELVKRLGELDVDPRTLDAIFITHAHQDHYRSAGTIQAKYGVPVFTEHLTLATIRSAGDPGSFGRVKDCRPVPDRIGDLMVDTFPVPHGTPASSGLPVGYVF